MFVTCRNLRAIIRPACGKTEPVLNGTLYVECVSRRQQRLLPTNAIPVRLWYLGGPRGTRGVPDLGLRGVANLGIPGLPRVLGSYLVGTLGALEVPVGQALKSQSDYSSNMWHHRADLERRIVCIACEQQKDSCAHKCASCQAVGTLGALGVLVG